MKEIRTFTSIDNSEWKIQFLYEPIAMAILKKENMIIGNMIEDDHLVKALLNIES